MFEGEHLNYLTYTNEPMQIVMVSTTHQQKAPQSAMRNMPETPQNWIFLWCSIDRNGPQGLTQQKINHVKAHTYDIHDDCTSRLHSGSLMWVIIGQMNA